MRFVLLAFSLVASPLSAQSQSESDVLAQQLYTAMTELKQCAAGVAKALEPSGEAASAVSVAAVNVCAPYRASAQRASMALLPGKDGDETYQKVIGEAREEALTAAVAARACRVAKACDALNVVSGRYAAK